jgi:hypothetical protein
VDPVLIAEAHRAAIAALDGIGDRRNAEILRVHGTEFLRLARLGQTVHDAAGAATDAITRKNRTRG